MEHAEQLVREPSITSSIKHPTFTPTLASRAAAAVTMEHGGPKQPLDSIAQFYTQLVQLPAAPAAQQEPQVQVQEHEPPLAQQQQQEQQQHSRSLSDAGWRVAPSQQPQLPAQHMPFAPVRFSSRTHLLDPNTGAVTLPPKAAAAAEDAGTPAAVATHPQHYRHKHQPHRQQQQQQPQQPMHPESAAHTASRQRPIDRGNLGYKLLSKAGWQEGQGLGASQQGMAAPLAVSWHKGSTGLGFSKQQQPQPAVPQQQPPAAAADAPGPAAAGAAAAAAGPVLGGKRVAAIVAAELASEDLDTKVKRHRQVQQAKAKEERDKAIQSYLYRAFNDVEAPDSNPLLAKSHRLTATNPLLD